MKVQGVYRHPASLNSEFYCPLAHDKDSIYSSLQNYSQPNFNPCNHEKEAVINFVSQRLIPEICSHTETETSTVSVKEIIQNLNLQKSNFLNKTICAVTRILVYWLLREKKDKIKAESLTDGMEQEHNHNSIAGIWTALLEKYLLPKKLAFSYSDLIAFYSYLQMYPIRTFFFFWNNQIPEMLKYPLHIMHRYKPHSLSKYTAPAGEVYHTTPNCEASAPFHFSTKAVAVAYCT